MRATEKVPDVMNMSRSVEEILQRADEPAERFENYEPTPADELDSGAVALLRAAVQERSQAERHPGPTDPVQTPTKTTLQTPT